MRDPDAVRFRFLLGVIFLFLAGCSYLPPPPDPRLMLAPSLKPDQSLAFQKAIQSEAGSPAFHKARIDYLLEVVSNSPYNFIRSGSRYTGKRAAVHFQWKYFRNRWQVKTAEEFIERVTTASKVTSQPYLVELPYHRRYPLRLLLLRELTRFDEELAKRGKSVTQTQKESSFG